MATASTIPGAPRDSLLRQRISFREDFEFTQQAGEIVYYKLVVMRGGKSSGICPDLFFAGVLFSPE
jgi:hypothetical protein